MKKTIAAFGVWAVSMAGWQNATAGDRDWAVVGKVLTGVAAAHVVAHVLAPPPTVVYQPAQPYYYAPVPVAPPPVVYAPTPHQTQVVYVQPAPVVVYQQPVYYAAAPVYVAPPPPVCVAPAPVFGLSFGLGFGFHSHHHRPFCR